MYVLGLTGGVGSGKTEAAKILQRLMDAELLLADELGHLVMKKGSRGYDRVIGAFGTEILGEDGEIDRKQLSEIVFSMPERLERLNHIVHPEVLSYMRQYIEERKEKKGILILESAIMFESGCDAFCDEVWYIFVPKKLREERLMVGRGYSKEKSAAIIKEQMKEEEYRRRCRMEIANDSTLEALEERLWQVAKEFLAKQQS